MCLVPGDESSLVTNCEHPVPHFPLQLGGDLWTKFGQRDIGNSYWEFWEHSHFHHKMEFPYPFFLHLLKTRWLELWQPFCDQEEKLRGLTEMLVLRQHWNWTSQFMRKINSIWVTVVRLSIIAEYNSSLLKHFAFTYFSVFARGHNI